ncbi:glycosyl hydrolase family 28-related protein [Metabacillus sp. RGM 3146]|uniref:glycosyl hydrolase family 28-related protein n=1 Tax=Metabacillus sp. RGM 3146 TaxID=3401092 RepID=UPI003B9BBAA9
MYKKIGIAVLIVLTAFFAFYFAVKNDKKISHPINSKKVINVKKYGAAGNGKKDDTQVIQKALSDGAGGKIYFPKGNYKISRELEVTDGTEVFGKDAELQAAHSLDSVIQLKGEDIHLHDLTIDGRYTSLKGITVAEGSKNITIKNSLIHNFTQPKKIELSRLTVSGVRIEGGVKDVLIDKSSIQNVKAKHPIKGWDHFVARGILISPESNKQPDTENVTISHSTFRNIGPKDDGDGIVVQGFKNKVNLKVLNNSFSYTFKRAIKIQSPGALIKGNKIYNNFNGNNFYSTYKETNDYDMWAAISAYANYVTIEKNTISGEGNYQRIIDVANASHIKITNNFIKNGKKGNYKNSDIVAITNNAKDNIKDFTVSNNVFINGRYGVYAEHGIPDLTVKDNKQINVQDYQYPYPSQMASE